MIAPLTLTARAANKINTIVFKILITSYYNPYLNCKNKQNSQNSKIFYKNRRFGARNEKASQGQESLRRLNIYPKNNLFLSITHRANASVDGLGACLGLTLLDLGFFLFSLRLGRRFGGRL